MKIKIGTIFKAIEGPGKGMEFIVTEVNSVAVIYKSIKTGRVYNEPRKHFEKYLQRVNKYWKETNKSYKYKKQELRGD